MNFDAFLDKLILLEKTISIASPITSTVNRVYFGAPAKAITDLPCIINALAEPDRTLGMASRREEKYRINVQLLAAKATAEDERSSRIAAAFWFSAKNVFDADPSICGTVMFSTLRGANPTVPVILTHAGASYIGFDAFLEVQNIEIV